MYLTVKHKSYRLCSNLDGSSFFPLYVQEIKNLDEVKRDLGDRSIAKIDRIHIKELKGGRRITSLLNSYHGSVNDYLSFIIKLERKEVK